MINKDKLVFDATDGGDEVAAFVKASDGTLITHTLVSGKDGLDVYLINASLVVTATDLDIRDLAFATDKVDASGSEVSLDAATLAALESITVSATDLDIRDLAFATDKVDVSGSEVSLDAATLAALESITVVATDLDIRDLTAVSDSVKVGNGAGTFLSFDADTGANVHITNAADIQVALNCEYAEDSVAANADIGAFVLSVRQDVLASSTSASGDYQSFKTDALGRLYTNDSNQSMAYSAISVTNTATDLVATDLVNRKRIIVQNLGTKEIYLGDASVTAATGLRIANGSNAELDIGAGVNLHGITASGASNIRIMELA